MHLSSIHNHIIIVYISKCFLFFSNSKYLHCITVWFRHGIVKNNKNTIHNIYINSTAHNNFNNKKLLSHQKSICKLRPIHRLKSNFCFNQIQYRSSLFIRNMRSDFNWTCTDMTFNFYNTIFFKKYKLYIFIFNII